jgi:CheY-like chemotaxis protein
MSSVEATHGERAALRRLMENGIDVVLTDVMMPGMNGYRLAQKIRAVDPTIPIICVTGYADAMEDPRHRNALLRKPYAIAAMRTALRSALSARQHLLGSDEAPAVAEGNRAELEHRASTKRRYGPSHPNPRASAPLGETVLRDVRRASRSERAF